MEKQYYLTTKKGLFYYTLWENSNFLGNKNQWYLFSRKRAAIFYSANEALEHKQRLIERIKKQGKDYIENHLKTHSSLIHMIPDHEVKIQKVIKTFDNLEVSEKIISLN